MQRLALKNTPPFRSAADRPPVVRAFMKGIGDHNAMLENRAPLDPLLNKIAMFQAGRAGIEMSKVGIDVCGCSSRCRSGCRGSPTTSR